MGDEAKNLSEFLIFDIETYNPNWGKEPTRRQELDPNKNSIVTVGVYDGNEMSIYPTIEDPRQERRPLDFFLGKLKEFEDSTIVGFNILRFDLPYLFHKAKAFGRDLDLTRLNLLDLFWVLPYWLNNASDGIEFSKRFEYLGNLWNLDKVRKYFLNKEPNPFPSHAVLKLYEKKEFADIEKHLELDLLHTYQFLKSPVIQETLSQLKLLHINRKKCEDSCPYKSFISTSSDKAASLCSFGIDSLSEEKILSPLDIIDFPLPKWSISWRPHCLE